MRKKIGHMMLLAAALSTAALAAHARRIQTLSYQQLLDRSDLVVIATPATKTADTAERAYLPNIFFQQPDGKQLPIASVGVETRFEINAVLKGGADVKRFVLHHYREATAPAVVDGPFLLSFDPAAGERHSYLMFLAREADGRFAPIGSQTDPGFQSILAVPWEIK